MRLKELENQTRVYMNPDDYDIMIESADSRRAEIAMRCMGEMGLRRGEVNRIKMGQIRESTHRDVEILFIPVWGKDTTGKSENGKRRDAWLPRDLKDRLHTYVETENLSANIPILPISKKTVWNDVSASAKHAAVKTGNDDFNHISPHDFRAYFATNMLLRKGVDVEIVMELGGWSDRKSMDPYLNASFDDIIQGGLFKAGLLSDEVEVQPSEMEVVIDELRGIKSAINEIDASILNNETPSEQTGLVDF